MNMCIIVDTCCLALVFDGDSKDHPKFAPVLRWIYGNGCMVYGGTKYNTELRKAMKYFTILTELSRARRAILMPTAQVDLIAAELKDQHPEPGFDDEHIVALVVASRCAVVCTNDAVAISYLRMREIFAERGLKRPSIYRGLRNNEKLCSDRNIVGVCRHRR